MILMIFFLENVLLFLLDDKTNIAHLPYSSAIIESRNANLPSSAVGFISQLHYENLKFKCTYCLKSFRQSRHLKNHIRIHTGDRPFICKFCNKTFTQLAHLNVHKKMHIGGKMFKCHMCDYSAYQNSNLKQHLKHKHYI